MIDPGSYDWSRFDIVFYYDQGPDELFRAWATPAGLTSFFIDEAVFTGPDGRERADDDVAVAGDRYRWDWRHPYWLEGEITAVAVDRQIAFTFGSMNVEIRFTRIDGKTELHLVQTGIPDSADGRVFGHLNCRSCWIFFLTNLKAVLDTGTDLRDTDPARVSSMEVGFAPINDTGGDPPGGQK